MLIIAFESSAKACSVALLQDGVLLAECFQNSGLTHSRTLLKMAEDMLHSCDLTARDVDAVACAAGPGSFTGVRIGLSAAKGFAWAGEKPCYGASTLEAMAYGGLPFEGLIVCTMDARRNQVYNALFQSDGQSLTRLCPDRAISIEELAADLKGREGKALLIGDGACLCAQTLMPAPGGLMLAPEHRRQQRASGVALCAAAMAARGQTADGSSLTPNYLRLSQAERERLEKAQSNAGNGKE